MRSVEDWAKALPLRRRGAEMVGPCPVCGGRDRFHIRENEDGSALVGCRGCMDGRDAAERSAAWSRVLDATWGPDRPENADPRKKRERRRREAAAAAARARRMIAAARLSTHPYLSSKGHPKSRGPVLRGELLVPARAEGGSLTGVQRILPDGRKLFLPGSVMAGSSHSMGPPGQRRWVCEGLATALSVRLALRTARIKGGVAVAFFASNLKLVARRGDLVVADNDENGIGADAARATGLPWWQPPRPGDANDYHLGQGLDALAKALAAFHFRAAGPRGRD